MSGYGIPYTVAVDGGDLLVMTVDLDGTVPDGYTAVVVKGGPVMLVPTVALVAVDTTPEEPEPGAWLIGDVMCARIGHGSGTAWATHIDRLKSSWWVNWETVWDRHGGPGITPRRLVPEPAPVELPWSDGGIKVHCGGEEFAPVVISLGLASDWLTPDQAEKVGRALLSAARAAREVAR